MADAHPEPPVSPASPSPPSSSPFPHGLVLPSLQKKAQPPRARVFALVDLDGAVVSALRRPRWVLSLFFAALFAVLPPVAFLTAAARGPGVEAVILGEMQKSGRLEKLTVEQRDKLKQVVVPLMTAALPGGAVVKRELWILGCAVVVLAILKGTRKELEFGPVVAAAVVGAAPWYVHDVLSAVVFSVSDLQGLDPQNPVASNVAAWVFSGKDTRTPLAVLLRAVDFFDVWGCAWLALALSRAVGGRSAVPVVVVVGGHALGILQAVAGAFAASR